MRLIPLLLASLSAGACGTTDDETPLDDPATVLSTPAGGIPSDTTTRGNVTAREDPRITERSRLVEDLRIGAIDAPVTEAFGQIVGIEVDPTERIHVLDRHAQAVQIFDSAGDYVRTVGGPGRGPGEFQEASGLALDTQNRLWVVDRTRFSVFAPDGEFVASHPRDVSLWALRWSGGFVEDGSLYDITGSRSTNGLSPVLVKYDSILGFVDTLSLPMHRTEPAVWEFMSDRRRTFVPVPFSPHPVWVLDRRGYLWTGVTSDYRLYQLTLTGDTVRVIEGERKPIPVAAAERDSIVRAVQKQMNGAGVDGSKIPSEKPAWVRFAVDDRGYVWVLLSSRHGSRKSRFDVFDPDGAYVGSIVAPAAISMSAHLLVRRSAVYGVVTNELGVQYVVRWRMEHH